MVKTRQKSFRAFIFESGECEECITYIDDNYPLLKDLLLIFNFKINNSLESFLKEKKLNFIESFSGKGELNLQAKPKKVLESLKVEKQADSVDSKDSLESSENSSNSIKTKVLYRTIRSGEEIISDGDLTIFGQINSGAFIKAKGNLQIFGDIFGDVHCGGEYMIIGKLKLGNVLFKDEIVNKDFIKFTYNKIYRENGEIIVKELV
ncbi:MAG: septum site-determining protein MinC [Helicobacter sp.]|nr:septum site-determining protein MinC [Helicobacter sp.]